MNIRIIKLFIITLLLCNSGCVTRALNKSSSYNETFSGYYISKRTNEVIFIGNKYHYFFDDPSDKISELIGEKWRGKLKISEISLRVKEDNQLYGFVKINFDRPVESLSESEETFIKKFGFRDDGVFFSQRIFLEGIRYKSARGSGDYNTKFTQKKYQAKIIYDLTESEKIAKAALSPLTIGIDGAIFFMGGGIVPAALFIITDERNDVFDIINDPFPSE